MKNIPLHVSWFSLSLSANSGEETPKSKHQQLEEIPSLDVSQLYIPTGMRNGVYRGKGVVRGRRPSQCGGERHQWEERGARPQTELVRANILKVIH